MDLSAIQAALRERNIDAWLFYDHHHRDPIAYRVLGLPPGQMVTRRWFYLIPADGEPLKLVHKIEPWHLDTLPGSKRQYSGWQELFDQIKVILANYRDIAMQYSPNNLVFTVSLVDGGTIDLVRGLGKNVVSSCDLVALFEATLTDEQIKSHFAARDAIDAITATAFQEIGRRVRNGGTNEHEIQQWILEAFRRENLVADDFPVVAVNANSGNPHYSKRMAGWEVDRAVRNYIKSAGFEQYFIHRTGHSIATDVHANGANMDDLEIHDERRILPNSLFSIEPGIYLPEFGVRLEVNMLVRPQGAEVTGTIQNEIVVI